MPSPNSNVLPIRLASDEQTWREMDNTINAAVSQILGQYDEDTVRDFMFLIDILTNARIDRVDRDGATWQVLKQAFMHSPRFERSLEQYLNEINPGRAIKRSRKQVSA